MKTTVFCSLFIAAFISSTTNCFAQQPAFNCGAEEYNNAMIAKHPAEVQQAQQQLDQATQFLFQHGEGRSNPTYIIPVVFHIIHDYGPENISDAQVLDEMTILNRDYAKLNADTANIIPQFQGIASAISIEFRLATIDPNGNCTNGIDRIASKKTNNADDGSKLNPWPRRSYLNVWVVKSIGANGVAGYAYYPSAVQGVTEMNADGVLILSNYIGSIGTSSPTTSRALTHEIGHCLSLEHPWGNTNAPGVACGDDGIPDTPKTEGWNHCPTPAQAIVCDTSNGGVVENYQNYMDYSYCSVMFTHDQMLAMHAALNSTVADRNHLSETSNLIATGTYTLTTSNCKPIADFNPNHTFVCQGGTIQYFDDSYNGTVTNRMWTFPGGTPSTSTAASPIVTYNSAGLYGAQLSVSNSQGADSISKNVTIGVPYGEITPPYSESFEDPTILSHGWTVVNYSNDNVTWQQTGATGLDGNSCMILPDFYNTKGEVDELITPQIDLRFLTGMTMTFDVSFATQVMDTSLLTEKFRVLASNNCGQTWNQLLSNKGYQFLTSGVDANNFVPPTGDAALWKTYTVGIPVAYAQAQVRFKFEFTGGDYGNQFLFDNLNITGIGLGVPESGNSKTFVGLFPNPAQDNTNIQLSLVENEHLEINLTDVNGRLVKEIANDNYNEGEHTIPFSTNGISPGIYFVTVYDGNSKQVRKLAITN